MTELDHVKRTKHPAQVLILAAEDHGQHPSEWRTLYVLGFGIAGAVLANAVLLFYFASLFASV